jgi:hypothetical protein
VFWRNWLSWDVQICLSSWSHKATANDASPFWSWYCAATMHVLSYTVCGSFRCVHLLHQMHTAWWSAILFLRSVNVSAPRHCLLRVGCGGAWWRIGWGTMLKAGRSLVRYPMIIIILFSII